MSKSDNSSKKSSAEPTSDKNSRKTEVKPPLTITQKITALNTQIAWFYSDDFTLDSALENYQASVALAEEIKSDLENLQNEIEIISKKFIDF